MRINAKLLLNHIKMLSVGGIIKEAVLGSEPPFAVTDNTKSVVTICSKNIVDSGNGEIGILNLKLFSQAVKKLKKTLPAGNNEIEMEIVGNMIVFKSDKGETEFPLYDPMGISSVVENSREVMEKISVGDATIVILNKTVRDECIKAIKLIAPKVCMFIVAESGGVTILVGGEKDHNATVDLGVAKGVGAFKLVVKPEYLAKVLSVLPKDEDATLEMRAALPLIFKINNYVFLLASMEAV